MTLQAEKHFAEAEEFAPEAITERPDGIPLGFRLEADGVYRRTERDDGDADWTWLCSPVRVLALPRDASGTGWGRLVEITDPDDRLHRWAIPAELFAGDGSELRREAFRLGLRLSTGRGARAAFSDLLQCWLPCARALTADRLGWADETCTAFVLGDGRVLGNQDVVYQTEHVPGAAREIRAAGSLDEWRATVAAVCIGNPILVGCVSLAFAGPLLEPLGLEGGGLHLRGTSSRGKSTAQRVAVSVWGSPRFLHSWRATANGLEGVASACNGSLLALDELGEVNGREAGGAAYMLANGQGKARAGRSGTARASARWRVTILSSGEISLADKAAEVRERVRAGQEVRLLDVPADRQRYGAFDHLHDLTDGAAFAEHVNRAAAASYGAAGPAFVQAVLADLDPVVASIRRAIDDFQAEAFRRFAIAEPDGQIARATKRFGLLAAAGEAASALGLTGWPTGEARDAAFALLELWLSARGGSGPAEAREAIERTRAFVSAHGGSRFQWIAANGEGQFEKVINRAGWRDTSHFYIASDAWRGEVHAGADPTRAAAHLKEAGLLDPDGDGRSTRRLPRGVAGRPRAYAVPIEILGAGDD